MVVQNYSQGSGFWNFDQYLLLKYLGTFRMQSKLIVLAYYAMAWPTGKDPGPILGCSVMSLLMKIIH